MALVKCRECGHAVSDTAKACPSCGVSAPQPKSPLKPTLYVVGAIVGLLLMRWAVTVDDANTQQAAAEYQAPAAPATPTMSPAVEAAAVQQFTGMPAVRHVEWLDGDFIIAAIDNGSSWQPVAEAACGWIRQRGAPAGFAVVVLEAAALQNGKWTQLARARCR